MRETTPGDRQPAATRRPRHWYALLAPLGALLFTLTWFVLGLISPGYPLFDLRIEPYDVVSQPISGLGLGVTGPVMNLAFVLCGVMLVVGAFGIARCWPPAARSRLWATSRILLAGTGLGMALCGLFTLESILLHSVGFLLALGLPAVSFPLFGVWLRRAHGERHLPALLFVGGVLSLALFVLFLVVFDPYTAGENTGVAGLVQRILAIEALGVFAVLGIVGTRRPGAPAADPRSTAVDPQPPVAVREPAN